MASARDAKTCAACGREFTWRRKWARCWGQVRFCSERCRRRRIAPVDRALEDAIRGLLQERTGTLCPSEAARRVGGEHWRSLLPAARAAARRLAARDEIVILQRGRRVEASAARGPIRLGRGPAWARTAEPLG